MIPPDQRGGAQVLTPASYGGAFMVGSPTPSMKGGKMLYTLAVILLVLWLLGMVGSYTLGGFIHILLVVALVMVVINLAQGRRAL